MKKSFLSDKWSYDECVRFANQRNRISSWPFAVILLAALALLIVVML